MRIKHQVSVAVYCGKNFVKYATYTGSSRAAIKAAVKLDYPGHSFDFGASLVTYSHGAH